MTKAKETKTKRKATKEKQRPPSEKSYGILLSPVITEKATLGSEHNQITFRVPVKATKPEIKDAVEKLFDVKVVAVNTLRQRGKTKRFKGQIGKRAAYKKAMVTLAEGEAVDVTTGI